jgi:hypothetical protein
MASGFGFQLALKAENAVGVLEPRLRGSRLVLRADSQQNPALLELETVALDGGEGLALWRLGAQGNPGEPVVADDAPPECVIEVEDQYLLRAAEHGADHRRDAVREGDGAREADSELVSEPRARVVPAIQSDDGAQVVDVVDEDASVRPRRPREPAVELAQEVGATVGGGAVEVAEAALRRPVKVVLDDRAVQGLQPGPDGLEPTDLGFGARGDGLLRLQQFR